jgi:hypothetical protein
MSPRCRSQGCMADIVAAIKNRDRRLKGEKNKHHRHHVDKHPWNTRQHSKATQRHGVGRQRSLSQLDQYEKPRARPHNQKLPHRDEFSKQSNQNSLQKTDPPDTADTAPNDAPTGFSWKTLGIATGVISGAVLIMALLIWWARRHRRRERVAELRLKEARLTPAARFSLTPEPTRPVTQSPLSTPQQSQQSSLAAPRHTAPVAHETVHFGDGTGFLEQKL